MPKFLDEILNTDYPIVISQYMRSRYGVGTEEELHWALMVVENKTKLIGHIYQARDQINPRTSTIEWEAHDMDATLGRSVKCLGGVQIGTVKARKNNKLHDIILSHAAEPKPDVPQWNCRDWVLEVVELLRREGWIDEETYPRSVAAAGTKAAQPYLLGFLKEASVQSVTHKQPIVYWTMLSRRAQ